MKRRRFVQAAVAAGPATPVLLAQGTGAPGRPPLPSAEPPKIELTVAEAATESVVKFFSTAQFDALRKLSALLIPPLKGAPGALDAHAPEFLDFLLSQSGTEKQALWQLGLDLLNQQAQQKFSKPFASLDDAQAAQLLSPLRKPWTYNPPGDPLERFLHEAKRDVRTATLNSREYVTSGAGGGGARRFGSSGLYWYPVD